MKINPAIQTYMTQSQGVQNTDTDIETKANFGEILQKQLSKVNELQMTADAKNQELITGEAEDLHSVLLATEEARLALEMTVQVRNKLVESYQEITRMQL